jgi:hypothetical protein
MHAAQLQIGKTRGAALLTRPMARFASARVAAENLMYGGVPIQESSVVLHPGDEMHFNCHVDTTKARADEIGVPLPAAPI